MDVNWLAWLAQAEQPAGDAPGASPFSPLFIAMLLMMVFFYFLILRPQKNEQKRRQQQLDTLGKGDQVVTAGGVHGTVESINQEEGTVQLSVAPKITMRFNKASVASITRKKGEKKDEAKTD